MEGKMKRFALLILSAALSACAASPAEQSAAKPPAVVPVAPAKANTGKAVLKIDDSSPEQYMTGQESALKTALKATPFSVSREKNTLIVSFAGTDAFASSAYRPKQVAIDAVRKIAPVLSAYHKTRIGIIGFANGAGKPATDREISQKRADNIAALLKQSAQIANARLWIEGRGADGKPDDAADKVDIVLTPTFLKTTR